MFLVGSESNNAVPVGTLLWTVFESIMQVFILCLAGYILARAGITDKATQRKMNVINVSLFTPALLFSKVAFSLTPSKLKELWIIPLGFVVVTAVSAAVAYGLGTIFRLKRSQRSFAMCAAMFQNSNSLPIALIQSLVIEVPGLKWGNDDSKDQMLGRALTYLVLYSTLGMMLRWSYGVQLLSQADDDETDLPASDLIYQAIHEEPESMEHDHTHPRASETDPIMSSPAQIRRETREDEVGIGGGSPLVSSLTNIWRKTQPPGSTPVSAVTPGSGTMASAHTMNMFGANKNVIPLVLSPRSTVNSSPGRRGSSHSRHSHTHYGRPRKLSRTESGILFLGLPEAPMTSHTSNLSDQDEESTSDSDNAYDSEDEEWGDQDRGDLLFSRRRQITAPPHTRFGAFLRRTRVKTHKFLGKVNQFMTVPMYSALLSIFIALIPSLQAALVRAKPLTQAIKSAGSCSIPMTLVVLGAFFYTPPVKPSTIATGNSNSNININGNGRANSRGRSLGRGRSPAAVEGTYLQRKFVELKTPSKVNPGENRTVFVAVVSRMVLVPLLLLPLLAVIARYDLFEAAADPVFILAATLIISSPPALTLAQITQAASGDAFERLISKTISWSYAVLTPPLTLAYVVLGLVFGRL